MFCAIKTSFADRPTQGQHSQSICICIHSVFTEYYSVSDRRQSVVRCVYTCICIIVYGHSYPKEFSRLSPIDASNFDERLDLHNAHVWTTKLHLIKYCAFSIHIFCLLFRILYFVTRNISHFIKCNRKLCVCVYDNDTWLLRFIHTGKIMKNLENS